MNPSRTLWIGNIEQWMTEDFILSIFSSFNVHPIKINILSNQISKGCCFVEFLSTEEAVNDTSLSFTSSTYPNPLPREDTSFTNLILSALKDTSAIYNRSSFRANKTNLSIHLQYIYYCTDGSPSLYTKLLNSSIVNEA